MVTALSSINLNNFFQKLTEHPPGFLMLDYDGTLAPLQMDRKRAYPYAGVEERLRKLKNFILISGRSVKDFDQLLKIEPKPPIWGSHGMEKIVDGIYSKEEIDAKTAMDLQRAEEVCPKGYYEVKPFGVALHWRGRENKESEVRPQFEAIARQGNLELHTFDEGMELRCKGKNKGTVVKELLKNIPENMPIAYLGDDNTDEDAFAALGGRGLKVLVRKEWRERSLADVQLIPPDELLEFLDRWIEATYD